ncbi:MULTISPECIES: matrixin family metalloprotease [Saccharibacillus]|uniref:matrixin family metalloprotease n=1 Tax=Saccharibacillus TaxID=456492 RepID=UPI00123995D1|nr:matrixin family metalloprotease [Saccharibacillus sp. WB 17]MWJ32157.1 hypothetical protein [Saccharibacillus sp. WB 17]
MKKFVVLLALVSFIVLSSSADATVFKYARSTGAKFTAFYDSSVASYGYTDHLDFARNAWAGISPNVSIAKSTTYKSPTVASGYMDKYYVGNSSTKGLYGMTLLYNDVFGVGIPAVPNAAPWKFSTISIYDNNLKDDGLKNPTNIRHTTTHELGHSLGLAHTEDEAKKSTSVMTKGDDPKLNRDINTPSAYDKNQLRTKY